MTWKDITIGRYLEAHATLKVEYESELDREIAFTAAVTGRSESAILQMQKDDFIALVKELMFLSRPEEIDPRWPKWFMIRGRAFRPSQAVNKLTTGQDIDLRRFAKGTEAEVLANLHKILATLCLPTRYIFWTRKYDGAKHRELSDFFYRYMTMDIAYPIAVFFWNHWLALMPVIPAYLESEIQKIQSQIDQMLSPTSSDGSMPLTD